MIGFVVGLLPFIVCMIVARRLGRRGLTGLGRPADVREPTDPQRGPDTRRRPSALTSSVPVIDGTVVTNPAYPPWTTLDDLQLDRLLKESSS